MADAKQKSGNRETQLLKCDLPPKEALKRAMLVPVPDYWTKKSRSRKTPKRK
jgi:hypothetical protein